MIIPAEIILWSISESGRSGTLSPTLWSAPAERALPSESDPGGMHYCCGVCRGPAAVRYSPGSVATALWLSVGPNPKRRRVRAYLCSQVRSPDHYGSPKAQGYPLAAALQRPVAGTGRMGSERGQRMTDIPFACDLNLASSLRHGVTTHSGRSWRGNLFTRCRCGT